MPNFAPWYRREEYALMREIMDDGEALPLTFDEWEKNAESDRAVATCEGRTERLVASTVKDFHGPF